MLLTKALNSHVTSIVEFARLPEPERVKLATNHTKLRLVRIPRDQVPLAFAITVSRDHELIVAERTPPGELKSTCC